MLRHFDVGNGPTESPSMAKHMHRQVYYEALDLSVSNITDRSDQPGVKVYSNVEQLLLKTCIGVDYHKELDAACTYYKGDLEQHELSAQLKSLRHTTRNKVMVTGHLFQVCRRFYAASALHSDPPYT